MMKIKTIILILALLPALLLAQGLANHGARIVVEQGARMTIDGNDGSLTNLASGGNDGLIFLDGRMTLHGSWYNNSDSTAFANADATGLVSFVHMAKAVHTLGGSHSTTFENLTINSDNTALIPANAEIRVLYDFVLYGTLEVNGTLYIEGSFENFGEITGTGTVYYQSTEPQIVAPGSYPNLVLDNSGGLVMTDSVYVETKLELSQGSLVLGEHNLVLGPDCLVVESKAPNTWVDATGTGMVIKLFDKTGTFEFPVGNFGDNPVYSPVTVELLSASFDNAQISVRLRPEVHPENNTGPDFPNYLTRYWVVESMGLSNVNYNIRFDYAESDVVGNETGIEGAKFVPADGFWKHFEHVNAGEHYFSGNGLTGFSTFSGAMENRIPQLAISYPAEGSSVYDTLITVNGTAYDIDGDLQQIYARINEGSWNLLGTALLNWQFDLPVSFGYWKIEAKAVDYQEAVSLPEESNIYVGVQTISLYEGWSHISAFLDPIDPALENIMAWPVGQNAVSVMLRSDAHIYWPSQNINTIGNWQSYTAYKLRTTGESSVLLKGDMLPDNQVSYNAGAVYLPVVTNVETLLEDAIPEPETNIRIIYNAHTNDVYWPMGGIYSLTAFSPGEGYQANFINPVTVSFPDYDIYPGNKTFHNSKPPENGPWPLIRTGKVHLVSVFRSALKELDIYSHIGAFNSAGDCIGFARVEGAPDQNVLLTIYGDDMYTAAKDGAETDELIAFKGYDQATGAETELMAVWNKDFPDHGGLFVPGGLSAITAFKEGQTGIGRSLLPDGISIYPNPADEVLYVVLNDFRINGESSIEILDATGSIVLKQHITHQRTAIDISRLNPGMYLLSIRQHDISTYRKVVVR